MRDRIYKSEERKTRFQSTFYGIALKVKTQNSFHENNKIDCIHLFLLFFLISRGENIKITKCLWKY